MSGITGWIDWDKDLTHYPSVLENMTETLAHRGPDASGTWISLHCALGHRRLNVMDPEHGAQPMIRKVDGNLYTIVYNGELFNAPELRTQLLSCGHPLQTQCDTEVLLYSYIQWGKSCVERLNGMFAFAIWNDREQSLFLARDRLGVKPLFYTNHYDSFIFGSELKALLAHPQIQPEIGADGLAELFIVGPARTPGHGIYRHISELKPAHYATYDKNGLKIGTYWQLESKEHEDDLETTAAKIRELLKDSLERQLMSDVPLGMLLSGGLDSSALTTMATQYYKQKGQNILHTYSVDFVDNDKHFKTNEFQPNSDAPWIKRMSEYLGSTHHYVSFDTSDLVNALKDAMIARDLPGMADIDASLLLFCREVKKQSTVAISGEAADEIFGGYPWFHREESLSAHTFPWAMASNERANIISAEMRAWIRPEQYLSERYEQVLDEVPRLQGEDQQKSRMREMSYLNITRFAPTLLDRKDRMSMAAGLEARVPFCDHRLIEYVWNIPWEMKMTGNREKGILRKALIGILPDDILTRKKSPYPKTHNPNYLSAVKEGMLAILNDDTSPLLPLINVKLIREYVTSDSGKFNLPWFGQLMTGPQLFAYFIQMDSWLRTYKVSIR